jgi:hypothetical protein
LTQLSALLQTPLDVAKKNNNPTADESPVCKVYAKKCNKDKMKAKLAMAIGLSVSDKDQTQLFDPEIEPWKDYPLVTQWKPSQKLLHDEIL